MRQGPDMQHGLVDDLHRVGQSLPGQGIRFRELTLDRGQAVFQGDQRLPGIIMQFTRDDPPFLFLGSDGLGGEDAQFFLAGH